MKNFLSILIIAAVLISGVFRTGTEAEAAFNKEINYQGKLTNSSGVPVADGTYHATFRLYTTATSATTTNIWEEDRSTAAGNRITVTGGLFSVLLGSSTPLSNVNFNQTLYLGVEIGGSGGSPSWDGEMTPRKKLGAVPAAFEAARFDGFATTSFLRSDAVNSTTTASTWLTFTNNGAGNIAVFTGSGNVGIGTSSPYAKLSVWGGGTGTGQAFEIVNNASTTIAKFLDNGTGYFLGNIGIGTTSPGTLLSLGNTGNDTINISPTATSTFGSGLNIRTGCFAIGGNCLSLGSATYLGLTDTPSTFTAKSIPYTNTGATALLHNANFVFDGTNLGIGTSSPYAKLSVAGETVASYFTATSTTATSTFAGDVNIGTGNLTYINSSGVTSVSNLQVGAQFFESDAGIISWTDMPVTSSASGGTVESYSAQLDGNPLLTMYGESTGSGDVWQTGVGIGTTTPFARLSIAGAATSSSAARPLFDIANSSGASFLRVTAIGKFGIGTTTPAWLMHLASSTEPQLALTDPNAGANLKHWTLRSLAGSLFFATSSDAYATSTMSALTLNTNGYMGIATTSPGSLLSLGGIANFTAATSTFYSSGGINLGSGCFAIGGNCISGGGVSTYLALTDTPSTFTAKSIPYTDTGATALLHSANFVFDGTNLGVGTSSPYAKLSVAGSIVGADYDATTTVGYKQGGTVLLTASSTIRNIYLGFGAGTTTNSGGTDNTFLGYWAGQANTTGDFNTAVGSGALSDNTLGNENTAIGQDTLTANTTGDANTAVGYLALRANTTGSSNTAVGENALLDATTGSLNTAVGYSALGFNSGNLTGVGNTANGYQSLKTLSSGTYNTAIGYNSGFSISTGYDNIFLGHDENTGGTAITTGFNNIGMGYNIKFPAVSSSNMMNIGNFLFANLPATTSATTLTTQPLTGKLGVGTSSPYAKLSVWGGGTGTGQAFEIVNNASTTIAKFLDNGTGYFLGNIGIGSTTPGYTLGVTGNASFGSAVSLSRRADIDTSGGLTLRQDNNAAMENLIFQNLDSTATTNHGNRMIWQFGTNTSQTPIDAGRLGLMKEQQWTSTASTQDSFMSFDVAANGALLEAMRINSSGNVGIGTTSPNELLTVSSVGSARININADVDDSTETDTAQLLLRQDGVKSTGLFGIEGSATDSLFIGVNSAGGPNIYFTTRSDGTSFASTTGDAKMTILNAGNVGIGTTSPMSALAVDSTGATALTVKAASGNTATFDFYRSTVNSGRIQVGTSNQMIFSTNNAGNSAITERMTITNTGTVGIGTTSPMATLEVGDSANTQIASLVTNSNGGTAAYAEMSARNGYAAADSMRLLAMGTGWTTSGVFVQDAGVLFAGGNLSGGLSVGTGAVAPIRFYINNTEEMRIDTTGNVGIGDTAPAYQLSVKSTSGTSTVAVLAGGATSTIAFGTLGLDPYTRGAAIDSYNNGSNAISLTFSTSNGTPPVERIRIDPSGNVGIGTTSPMSALAVDSTGATALTVKAASGNTATFDFYRSTVNSGRIQVGTSNQMIFSTNNAGNSAITERMTIDNNGDVGVASTSPWRKFSVTGTVAFDGLTSSATGNAVCITTGKDITNAGGGTCTPSSIRFKENVEKLSQGFALEELNRLEVVSFDYKDGAYSPEDLKGSYGLIAEEVEKTDPKLVDYGYDGKPLTLKFEKFIGLLIQAVQELLARVTGLEGKMDAQQAEIDMLKTRMNAIDGQATATVVSPPVDEPVPAEEDAAAPPEEIAPESAEVVPDAEELAPEETAPEADITP